MTFICVMQLSLDEEESTSAEEEGNDDIADLADDLEQTSLLSEPKKEL